MQFNLSVFTGNKFCLFNYAAISTGGFVDFDWFRIDWGPLTGVIPEEDLKYNYIPPKIYLGQNYPNPFNPSTLIAYQLPVTSKVILKVFDILGRDVATLVNEEKPAGAYNAEFNAAGLASGVYFYSLQSGNALLTRKLIISK
jgi:hypothetical protein